MATLVASPRTGLVGLPPRPMSPSAPGPAVTGPQITDWKERCQVGWGALVGRSASERATPAIHDARLRVRNPEFTTKSGSLPHPEPAERVVDQMTSRTAPITGREAISSEPMMSMTSMTTSDQRRARQCPGRTRPMIATVATTTRTLNTPAMMMVSSSPMLHLPLLCRTRPHPTSCAFASARPRARRCRFGT